ncbi:MAG: Cytochrome P450 [Lasallia pustulata]|uniref:Cytochrome P450 n=1 Tax=Lasallia pustulata TaxID=136370 RepID=A0A5M8Q1A7_9LECA|nr:MAG: Cytochrome P450 [Lasallia pustulata]
MVFNSSCPMGLRFNLLQPSFLAAFSGRYPWTIDDALRKYGDVLRIAPNKLAFFTPQAFLGKYSILTSQQFTDRPSDIYSPQQKNLEVFVKRNFENRGKDLGGIAWEQDPIHHREVAKKLSPAFSN